MLPSWGTLCSRQSLNCPHETHMVCLSKLSVGGASRLGLDHSAGTLRGTLLAGSQVVLKLGAQPSVLHLRCTPHKCRRSTQDAV